MFKKIVLLFVLISNYTQAQRHYFDYVVKKNGDTIHGFYYNKTIRKNIKGKFLLGEIKTIQKEGKIYNLRIIQKKYVYSKGNDSLLSLFDDREKSFKKNIELFVHKLKTKDYVITHNDTIYGKISLGLFNNFVQRVDGEKKQIHSEWFYKGGYFYEYKKKRRMLLGDSESAYLKVLYNGKVKLYEYRIPNNSKITEDDENLIKHKYVSKGLNYGKYHFIEFKNEMIYLIPGRTSRILLRTFPNVNGLENLLRKRILGYNNLYTTISYINDNL